MRITYLAVKTRLNIRVTPFPGIFNPVSVPLKAMCAKISSDKRPFYGVPDKSCGTYRHKIYF